MEQSVHTTIDQRRETRIGVLESRLREVRGHAENEFGVAQAQGRARSDFERSR
jgi:hypothetical protein